MGNRREFLIQAAELVEGDRNVQYGDPNADFSRIAEYWNTTLKGLFDKKLAEIDFKGEIPSRVQIRDIVGSLIEPHVVAMFIDLQKTSRLIWSPDHMDNWIDKMGYSACGAGIRDETSRPTGGHAILGANVDARCRSCGEQLFEGESVFTNGNYIWHTQCHLNIKTRS